MAKMLQVRNLMVFFENALALNNFSMEIQEKEVRGVIGSNSAGKTTLMNALSGLIMDMRIKEQRRGGERITVLGSIHYLHEEITHLKPADRVPRGIVLCRERHPVFLESDVIENLKISGYLRSRNQIQESIEFILGIFPQLKALRKKQAGFLSGGEQQMLSIGMALVARPKLLLLDEPLLGLSPVLQKHLVGSIIKIRNETGITILITEQFARPVLPMLDYVYIIENGMMTLSGKGTELMDNPEVRSAYFGA
jgi:branched-chain amino acid transport system ATP-binding protein